MSDTSDIFWRLSNLVNARPFAPFVVVAADAEAYGVSTASQAMLFPGRIVIDYPRAGFGVTLPFAQIVAIDTLPLIKDV